MPEIRVAEILEATTGGTRRHLFDLATGLDPTRFHVTVIASSLRDPGFESDREKLETAGIRVHPVPMRREIHPLADLRAFCQIVRILRAGRFHIVHTHSSKAGILGRWAAHVARVPAVVHTPHVFPFLMEVPAPRRTAYALLEWATARVTDRILCLWDGERDAARRWRIAPDARFAVIPNGIVVDEVTHLAPDPAARRAGLGIAPTDRVIGVVGRYSRQKGHRFLVEAAPAILAAVPAARFLFVGGGAEKEEIRRQVRAMGLDARFLFLDQTEEIYSIYPVFDLFAIPSLWEGLPYSLLEAMAFSKPVVATHVGGVADLVADGDTGRLVPPGDPAALAEAVIGLLRDDSLRARMGQAGRQRVDARFPREVMLRRIAEVYEDLHRGTR